MEEPAGIYARDSAFLGCHVQLGVAQGRVISVDFPAAPAADAEADHQLLDRIDAYLEGGEDDFADVSVALTVPTDQRAVLEAVRRVPYGEQVTVEQLAGTVAGLEADDDANPSLVREALAANPAPLFVPDHRVRDGPSGAPPAIEQKLRALEEL